MRRILIATLIFLCLCLDSSKVQAQADPINEIIQRVNALRAVYGRPAYQVDYALMYAAQVHAEWGLANNDFGHAGPDGSMPDERARAAGYGEGQESFAVENVHFGTASLNTPEFVVTMWQSDWGHLSAMISADYEHIGVGFAEANGFSYYVMMAGWVGAKASAGEPQGQENPTIDTPASNPFVISEPEASGAIYHEVQPGQAAWTIAAQYGIELAELFALNNLTENSILHPGDMLVIQPPDPPTSTPPSTPTSTSTMIRSTLTPTHTPAPVQAAEVNMESEVLTAQNQGNISNNSTRSNVRSVSLAAGLGLILSVSVIMVIRLRKRS